MDFFDVYLLHWLNGKHYEIAEKYREFEFLEELKKTGKAIKTGFSYHDSADLLDVKGGALAALPEKAGRLLEKLSPDASQASYAIRFAESLPEVEVVLSGMNTMEQLLDNLACRQPLTEYE